MATILVVDDRPTNRQFLLTLLGYADHRLLEAADGAQALALVRAERPDLVITDILMPTMDGYEFVRRLRAEPEIADTKIIFYTATYSVSEARKLAETCGVETVLPKPCDPQDIFTAVNRSLGVNVPVPDVRAASVSTGVTEVRELYKIGDKLTAYLGELGTVKQAIEGIIERGEQLTDERERLQQLSRRFAENLVSLQGVTARLTALEDLTAELMAHRKPEAIVTTFLRAAARIIAASHAAIGVLDEREQELTILLARGLAADVLREHGTDRTRLPGSLLDGRKPLRCAGPRAAKLPFPGAHPRTNSFLGLRIATEERVYGWLYFANRLGAAEFSDEDERLAITMAAQLALLYENASLYHLIQHHAAQLQIEVNERRRAQEALQEREAGLRQAQVMAKLAHIVTGPDGAFESWSDTFPELIGLERARMPRNTRESLELIHPDDRALFRGKSIEAARTGKRTDTEYRLKRPDGDWIHVRHTMEPLPGTPDPVGRTRWFNTLQDVTAQKKAEAELRDSELRFRQLAENIHEVFFLIDPANTQTLYVSPAYEDIWGRSVSSLYENPRSWTDLIHPDDRERIFANLERSELTGQIDHEYRIVRADGATRWIHERGFPIRDEAGNLYRIAGIAENITERKEAENKIKRLNRVHAVLSAINSLIVRVNDREDLLREACRIATEAGRFSSAWAGLLDRATNEVKPLAWQGVDESHVLDIRRSVDESLPEGQGPIGQALREKRALVVNDIEHEARSLLRARAVAAGSGAIVVLPLITGEVAVGVLVLHAREAGFFDEEEMKLLNELASDIAFALDHIEKAEKVDYLAYYDQITGLANRTLLIERLKQLLHAAGLHDEKIALVLADIERLRTINESLGRHAGDALLKQLAERMARCTDPVGLARIGADQFAIVLPEVGGRSEVRRRLEQLWQKCLSQPFTAGNTELRVSVKAGIALCPSDGKDAETLLRNAEAALRRAKALGERQIFYTATLTERTGERFTLENRLRQALEKDEFVLHYQPKVKVGDRRIVGVEALIRWQNPELGLVPPGQFIPLMEETGLILEAGAWALARAVADHSLWLERGVAAPRIAVNVSAIQLRRREFVATVAKALEKGVSPPGIDLEITESLVMEDIEQNIAKLKEIRALGIEIAIDDFGTGYSSLGYLAKLPVQSLKIDRSFIVAMPEDPDAMTLVQTIITLAHSLGLKVVAEGVESEEQAKFLRLLRCNEMQGYLFSKPLPFEAMTALLKEQKP